MLHLHCVMEGVMACVLSVGDCVTEVPQYVILLSSQIYKTYDTAKIKFNTLCPFRSIKVNKS